MLEADDDEKEHVFKEPDWDKRPDDYAESRIWFKLDEITNYDDYFYLKGKTNLIEASSITGKYSEVPYFILTFNPSEQWESICENYGFNEEKLVGQNIKCFGDNLILEEKVEYMHDK